MVPLGSKSVTLNMQIDAGEDLCYFDRINRPLTLRNVYLLKKLALIVSESSFGAYINFVRGGLRGSAATSALVPLPPNQTQVLKFYFRLGMSRSIVESAL